ncbi:GNAT family N-acetyltransferase [Amphibacillus sediminis]|uniref:GNAT family N-acetyltransferase n=1 Tax=Amphibacillus sediminis TaxID=360185 RepID=UPI000833D373|nr:GNAT family N-acetyltransferase [Amphibacillus sediminis]
MQAIKLSTVPFESRNNYLELLLMADENIDMVKSYMNEGELYLIQTNHQDIGIALFTFPEHRTVELKNFAFAQDFRGKGFGKQTIQEARQLFKTRGYQKMIVATANSSIANIAFYQKVGFRLTHVELDFFNHYHPPIYEYGIKAQDKLIFQMPLN